MNYSNFTVCSNVKLAMHTCIVKIILVLPSLQEFYMLLKYSGQSKFPISP